MMNRTHERESVTADGSLRVCHVINNLSTGGAETMLLKLLRGSASRAVASSVISLMGRGEIGPRIEALGVPVTPLGMPPGGVRLGPLLRLPTLLREARPDVVCTWLYQSDLLGGIASRMALGGRPVVWHLRTSEMSREKLGNTAGLARAVCSRLSGIVPTVIVANSAAVRAAHEQLGYRRDRIVEIPNGFDLEHFRPSAEHRADVRSELRVPPATKLVGMAARFDPAKDHDTFLEAALLLCRRRDDVHFVLCGRGVDTDNHELGARLAASPYRDRFHLLGLRSDMPRIQAALDVGVLASRSCEGFPNAVGEAMACGVPCVVTDTGGSAEVVGDCGVVVSARDPVALSDACAAILSLSSAEAAKLGRRARERMASCYGIDSVVDAYVGLWRSLRHPRPKVSRPARLAMIATVPQTHRAFLKGQARYMVERGFDLHLISSPGPLLEEVGRRDDAVTHGVPMTRELSPFRDLMAVVRLCLVLRRIRPDIVHLSTPKAALLGAIASWICRVPARIFLFRGSITENASGWRRAIYRCLEGLTARLCHKVVAVSPSLLEFTEAEGIVPPAKGMVIGSGSSNGVDANRFDPRAFGSHDRRGDPVVGFVGDLRREKGIEDLAAAWWLLRDRFPRARLLLVGDWDDSSPVSSMVRRELEKDDRVNFTGYVADVRPFFAQMTVLAFPSQREGFPNACLEASAMAVPVVGTRVSGVIDAVVEGISGMLVNPGDHRGLADCLAAYLADPTLAKRHGAAARSRVERDFQPREIWKGMAALYESFLDGNDEAAEQAVVTESTRRRAA